MNVKSRRACPQETLTSSNMRDVCLLIDVFITSFNLILLIFLFGMEIDSYICFKYFKSIIYLLLYVKLQFRFYCSAIFLAQ